MAELMYRMNTRPVVIADGKASYYGEKFHGRTTASGEVFDASAMTAAHRTYPFGTHVKVTNVANNESVVVRITDRGPYSEGRVIDLSKAAFEAISPLSRGVIEVALEVVDIPDSDPIAEPDPATLAASEKKQCPEIASLQSISSSTYEGVTLDSSIPNRITSEQVLTLSGTVSNGSLVRAFVVDSQDEQTIFSSSVRNNHFQIDVFFPSTGRYQLGLLVDQQKVAWLKKWWF
ncbi:septal ring lytic transglycosylase RlpA family protein [Candidatus Peregrinibacteria bacterium]|nr:MAG: septal ring lytic transglycosylase RlpA family protein [Candidatus Peregrinibacteria bacterium]